MDFHAACRHLSRVRKGDTSLQAIGDRLVATRLALGYENASEFAQLAGLTPQSLSNYEKGYRRPDLDQAFKLNSAFGLTLDWLYYGDRSGLPHRIASRLPPELEARHAS